MAITKEQKAQILQDLVDKFGRSKAVVFSDYRGLDVSSISNLRDRLREKGAETKVAKKTLIRLAAKESNIGELGDEVMEGPVSVTFSYEDEMAGLKALFKFSKENKNLKLLGGIINGKVASAEEIIQLAKLPSHEELIAKFIGSINAPVSGFVGILNNVLGGFVRVLQAYKDSLPASAEPSSAEATEAPAPADKPSEEAPKKEEKVEEPKAEIPAKEEKPEEPAPEAEKPKEEAPPEEKPAEETAPPEEETPAEPEAPAEKKEGEEEEEKKEETA